MVENYMQALDNILQDSNLYDPNKIRIRMDKDAYCRRREQFGRLMEEMIKTGLIAGTIYTDGIPVSVIWFRFPRIDSNAKTAELDYHIEVEHRDKRVRKNQIQRTAVVTISFKKHK